MENDNDRDLVRINIEAAERRWVREEHRDSNQSKIIILITVCIITIIGSSFIFSGVYENFFYEKGKNDLKAALNSMESSLKSYKPLNTRAKITNTAYKNSKKWRRTIWEVYKGKVCTNPKNCTYHFDIKWKDCYVQTNTCKFNSKRVERTKYVTSPRKTSYI